MTEPKPPPKLIPADEVFDPLSVGQPSNKFDPANARETDRQMEYYQQQLQEQIEDLGEARTSSVRTLIHRLWRSRVVGE